MLYEDSFFFFSILPVRGIFSQRDIYNMINNSRHYFGLKINFDSDSDIVIDELRKHIIKNVTELMRSIEL